MRKKILMAVLFLACFASVQIASAQTVSLEQLSAQLEKNDGILFNAAFNTCNLNQIETVLSKDFVFYLGSGYGAHLFCQIEDGKGIRGIFKFVHVWKKVMMNGRFPE